MEYLVHSYMYTEPWMETVLEKTSSANLTFIMFFLTDIIAHYLMAETIQNNNEPHVAHMF